MVDNNSRQVSVGEFVEHEMNTNALQFPVTKLKNVGETAASLSFDAL